jgi:hypothetical protein
VPLLDGEWEFIAIDASEIADTPRSQCERVTESPIRCPNRDRGRGENATQ